MGDFETVNADPEHIDHLVKSMLQGMRDACVVGITTDADLLSAVFTVLLHLLKITKSRVAKEEYEVNAKEIGRVLTDLLMEFGPSLTVN